MVVPLNTKITAIPGSTNSSLQFQYQLLMKGTGRHLLYIPKVR